MGDDQDRPGEESHEVPRHPLGHRRQTVPAQMRTGKAPDAEPLQDRELSKNAIRKYKRYGIIPRDFR
jgi:hypothetical protein